MSDYTKIVDYAAKDALLTGNPAKLVKGTEIGAEFDAIATAVATKHDSTDIGVTVQAYDADLTTWAGVTPGTGVATALAVNVGTAGAPVVLNGALGTPSSGTVTNLTGTASININGTVGATTPAAATVTSLNGGQLAGLRNKIINGGFKVDQRNAYAAQTITAAAALAYTADRWYAYCTGANVTGQVVAGASQTQKRYQFTGAASVTAIGFGTRLEAKDTYDLNSQTVTISADLANSVLTTVTWTLYRATTSDDTFGSLASPTVTSVATGTFTVDGTVTRYNAQASVTAASTTGLQLVLSVGAQTSGTWTIGNVQLELGSTATPFETRPYGMELALCQRYLPVLQASREILGSAYGTTGSIFNASLPVMARVAPTGIAIPALSNFTIKDASGAGGAPTGLGFSTACTDNIRLNITTTAGTPTQVLGDVVYITLGASAYIQLTGCEL